MTTSSRPFKIPGDFQMLKTNRRNQTPRNLVAKLMGWNADANALEQRIVPAYVAGDFGWAASIDSTQAVVDPGYNLPFGARNSALAKDISGNSYIVGYYSGTVDFDPAPNSVYTMVASGGNDGFIIKLDSTGKFNWGKSISGTSNEAITALKVFNDGTLIIGGRFAGSIDLDPGASQKLITSQGGDDGFIEKLDSSGVMIWSNTFGGSGNDEVQAISIDLNQNVLVSTTVGLLPRQRVLGYDSDRIWP